jgi:formamidopyrimidine-DNA glycosylase
VDDIYKTVHFDKMQEGLEVYMLGVAIQKLSEKYVLPFRVETRGKNLLLIFQDRVEVWTFGLHGRIKWHAEAPFLTKLDLGIISGSIKTYPNMEKYREKSGCGGHPWSVDFSVATRIQIDNIVEMWKSSDRMLGCLLLDQTYIYGIGTAWGSEILHDAGELMPDIAAKVQQLDNLTDSICRIRDKAFIEYMDYFMRIGGEEGEDGYGGFVNAWTNNLYKVRRNMKVYKCGTRIQMGNREWWIA